MNGDSCVDGILLGYLPHEGICEIKLYEGAITGYGFTPSLIIKTRAEPNKYLKLIGRQVRLILDRELWVVDRIELNEVDD